MFQSASFGLQNPLSLTIQQLSFNCPNGDCRWKPFQSLAVCSTCTDIHERLSKRANVTGELGTNDIYILPNGLGTINNTQYGMVTYSTPYQENSIAFSSNDLFIWSVSIINLTRFPTDLSDPIDLNNFDAFECMLQLCVNNYTSTVTNGIVSEDIIPISSVTRVPGSWSVYQNDAGRGTPSDDIVGEIGPNDSIYRTDLELSGGFKISETGVETIDNMLSIQFITTNLQTVPNITNVTGNVFSYRGTSFSPDNMRYLYYSDNITATFESLAMGMTNAMRAHGDNSSASAVKGESGNVVAYYVIQWPWVSLPVLLNLLGYWFVLLGRRRTRKVGVPLWKSCPVAVMSRGAALQEHFSNGTEVLTATALHKKTHDLNIQLLSRGILKEDEKEGVVVDESLSELETQSRDAVGDEPLLEQEIQSGNFVVDFSQQSPREGPSFV
jgi:hypothetical protein